MLRTELNRGLDHFSGPQIMERAKEMGCKVLYCDSSRKNTRGETQYMIIAHDPETNEYVRLQGPAGPFKTFDVRIESPETIAHNWSPVRVQPMGNGVWGCFTDSGYERYSSIYERQAEDFATKHNMACL